MGAQIAMLAWLGRQSLLFEAINPPGHNLAQTSRTLSEARSAAQPLRTGGDFRPVRVAVGALAASSAGERFWRGLVLIVPAAGFLIRLFMIQHDCGHGAFFGQRQVGDWIGRAIGVLTLTPYDIWRRSHAIHHATSGNLDARGTGDVKTLTVSEYRAVPLGPLRLPALSASRGDVRAGANLAFHHSPAEAA